MDADERAGAPARVEQRRGGAAAARSGAAGAADQPLGRQHRRRQRLHPLQRDPGRLLRPAPGAGPVRGRPLRADRGGQLGDRDPPGAEGQGDARPARAAGGAQGEGGPRRRADRAARRGGRAGRPDPGRARRPAGRRRRRGLDQGTDDRRVDPDRRVRRGSQARRRPGAVGRLLPRRLRLLRGRRGARGQPRRAGRGRGEGLPAPAVAAPARGQPRPERDHDRDGAARRPPAARLLGSQRRAPGGRADGGSRPGDADPRGPGAADEHHPGGGGRPPGADGHARPADSRDRGAGRRRHDLRGQDRDAHRRHPRPGLGRGGGQDPAGGGPRGPGPLRALGRGAESDPPDDRRALPGQAGARRRRGALLVGVEVERHHPRRAGIDPQLRDGGARRARPGGGARADPQARADARGAHGRRAARGRLRRGVGGPAGRPWQPASAAARAASPGGAGGAASPRRRGDDRVHAPASRWT